jgi:quercetin dioxygenase-like cupin family protein
MLVTIPAASTRRTETPNALMTTLASPTLGASSDLSLWQVEMEAGARGPAHSFDSEQLWTVLEGAIRARVGGEEGDLVAGDTLVLPAGAMRQIVARAATRLLVCGHGDAIVRVDGEDRPRGTPEWIA